MKKKKSPKETNCPTEYWAVLRAFAFSDLQAGPFPLKAAKGEPEYFIPCFIGEVDAICWNGNSSDNIVKVISKVS